MSIEIFTIRTRLPFHRVRLHFLARWLATFSSSFFRDRCGVGFSRSDWPTRFALILLPDRRSIYWFSRALIFVEIWMSRLLDIEKGDDYIILNHHNIRNDCIWIGWVRRTVWMKMTMDKRTSMLISWIKRIWKTWEIVGISGDFGWLRNTLGERTLVENS